MTLASLLLAFFTATTPGPASPKAVLLDFHSRNCGPCREMRPVVKELQRLNYPIRSIDVDQSPDLAERYGIQAVPTFIVTDARGRELDRTSGYQPAGQLAKFYRGARAKVPDPGEADTSDQGRESDDDGQDTADARPGADDSQGQGQGDGDAEGQPRPAPVNPRPWETVVRIRVLARGSIGFGSGTIIKSTPKESLILTCAHIFKLEGQKPVPPDRFPRQVMIDLFDGKLRGQNPAQVHFAESVEGEPIDYDFALDVGLIRIRPGRRLPAARVVPAHWEPRQKMRMMTVGCSEGHDATAWPTVILNPQMRGLSGNPNYEAIECHQAPKQGRSGGGLYTTDGYVAGVCNFAEPRGNHGLYATPRSIYNMLDRNGLMALYAPVTQPAAAPSLMADRGSRHPDAAPVTKARGQSPEDDEAARDGAGTNVVMIPPPDRLGIRSPIAARSTRASLGAPSGRRTAWSPTHNVAPSRSTGPDPDPATTQTDLNLDSSADHDRFLPDADESTRSSDPAGVNVEDVSPKPSSPAVEQSRKSRWRASRTSSDGTPIREASDR